MPRAPLRRHQPSRNGPIPRGVKKIPSSSPAKAELAKKLAHKPIGARPTDSDDSDKLVVKGNGWRGRNVPRQEIYASGAVGAGDKPGNHPTRAQRRKNMTEATREILANGQREARREKESVSAGINKQHQQPKEKSPHVNGVTTTVTSMKKDVAPDSTASSPAVKPPGSVLRSVQPTPTRENAILGTLKPRRRQPSILQTLDQDSSSFDLEDEEEFLPDDESTPFNHSKPQQSVPTPASTSPLLSSSSRKRKFGVSNPLDPAETEIIRKHTTSPPSRKSRTTPEPSLPTVPVSALRQSGRKHRESIRDEDDIMALPESSSSAAPSPAKTKTLASTAKTRKQASKPVPIMTTNELQVAMMPSKRQRTARERTRNRGDFEIPADSDPEEANEEDDSSFLLTKRGRKTRRKEPLSKPSNIGAKAKSGKAGKQSNSGATAAAKSKSKSSTNHLTTTTAPILTPSTSNRETKSPSQQSTTNISSNTDAKMANGGGPKQYGGSHRQRRGTASGQDKENQVFEGSNDGYLDAYDVEAAESEVGEDVGETKGKLAPVSKDKWAEIDAWDMDFEDVEAMTGSGSSSPTRR